jgi:DNA-binding NarL/FixJ family response regulator
LDKCIRLFILSDNRLFREALARIFSKKTGIDTVRSCHFGAHITDELLSSDPDVLLLDSAPALCSEFARLIRERQGKQLRIIMVAMKEDEDVFLEVVRQGAYGYVPKDASAIELVNAVRAVSQGEAVCPPRLCKRLFDLVAQLASESRQPMATGKRLSRREEQLIPLIDRGLTNKEIAAQLNLSEKTVKNHVHRILRKVGAQNRFGVAAACRSNGSCAPEASFVSPPLGIRPS